MLDSTRAVEAGTRELLAAVEDHLRQARELGDWFGFERYDPYIAAMRDQRRQLQSNLDAIGTLNCPPGDAPPLATEPR